MILDLIKEVLDLHEPKEQLAARRDLIAEFESETQASGISLEEIRSYSVVHLLRGGTANFETDKGFDLPDPHSLKSFLKKKKQAGA